jgi:hypothetical protein
VENEAQPSPPQRVPWLRYCLRSGLFETAVSDVILINLRRGAQSVASELHPVNLCQLKKNPFRL